MTTPNKFIKENNLVNDIGEFRFTNVKNGDYCIKTIGKITRIDYCNDDSGCMNLVEFFIDNKNEHNTTTKSR